MINEKRVTDLFFELTAIDSPSFKERAFADCLKVKLADLGFEVSEDDRNSVYGSEAGNVLAVSKGSLPGEPLLFCAHMDTVEPAVGKKAVLKEDGRITSDGSTVLGSDDVAGIVEILEAVRHLDEEGIERRSLELLFPFAEEPHLKGSRVFDHSVLKAKEAYVLDMSGAPGAAALKAPTIIQFDVVITGKAAHAGFNPEEGKHAIAAAAAAISEIRSGRLDEETTCNVGKINGGLAMNIVPERCAVSGEVRSYRHERAVSLIEEIRGIFEKNLGGCAMTFETDDEVRAYDVEPSHPVVKRFEEACKETGLPGTLTKTFGGSDNNNFMRNGITGIVLSCGMNAVHSTAEYTSVDELVKGTELVAKLMTLS